MYKRQPLDSSESAARVDVIRTFLETPENEPYTLLPDGRDLFRIAPTPMRGLGLSSEALVRSGAIDCGVVDSVGAMVPRAEIEGERGDAHVGLQARLDVYKRQRLYRGGAGGGHPGHERGHLPCLIARRVLYCCRLYTSRAAPRMRLFFGNESPPLFGEPSPLRYGFIVPALR